MPVATTAMITMPPRNSGSASLNPTRTQNMIWMATFMLVELTRKRRPGGRQPPRRYWERVTAAAAYEREDVGRRTRGHRHNSAHVVGCKAVHDPLRDQRLHAALPTEIGRAITGLGGIWRSLVASIPGAGSRAAR